jgi:ribonuclease Z
MKRVMIYIVLVVMTSTLLSCQKIVENRINKGLNRQKLEILKDDKMHVFLVGSGGPINNSKRVATSTAIIAGGTFLLVDVGPGTWRNADLLNLPLGNLSTILLTHFHSDHIGDLGEANFGSWVAGREKSLEIYGPEGVEQVVSGFTMAYALDTKYRIAHHGESVLKPAAAVPVSRTVIIENPDGAELVFERNGLRVFAFMVDHYPVEPAFGYRFEYKGNRVVISGDTKKTPNLIKQSKNADILISNALSFNLVETISKTAMENNRPRLAKITKDIMEYLMDPVQAAEVAKEAGAKTLVLAHIVPPVTNFILKRMFMKGVGDVYDGEVVMGEDGMTFTLDPKSSD